MFFYKACFFFFSFWCIYHCIIFCQRCFVLSLATMEHLKFLFLIPLLYKHILIFFCLDFTDPSINILSSGPYGLIFASFVPFYFDIPVSTRFRVFRIRFSDKSFIYLAGLQVIIRSVVVIIYIFFSVTLSSYNAEILFCIISFPFFYSSFILSWVSSCSFFCLRGKDLFYRGSAAS